MVQRLLLAWVLASVPATAFIVLALRASARIPARLVPVPVPQRQVTYRQERRVG